MDTKKWWTSKMIWFNAVTLFLAILALPELTSILPVMTLPYLAFFNAVGNIVLRFLTVSPIE